MTRFWQLFIVLFLLFLSICLARPSPLQRWTNPSSKSPPPPLTPLPSTSPPITPSFQPFNPSSPIPALCPSVTFSLYLFPQFLPFPCALVCLILNPSIPINLEMPKRPKAKKGTTQRQKWFYMKERKVRTCWRRCWEQSIWTNTRDKKTKWSKRAWRHKAVDCTH